MSEDEPQNPIITPAHDQPENMPITPPTVEAGGVVSVPINELLGEQPAVSSPTPEADDKTTNPGNEQVNETAGELGEIGLEAAIDNTPNRTDNVEEYSGPETLDPLSQNDKEIAEDEAFAQKEVQDMIANVKNSSLTEEQKAEAVKRLSEKGAALAEEAKLERLKVREEYEKVSGDIMGRILDFQVNDLRNELILDTGRVSFNLFEYGMDKNLVDLTYSILGIDPPTEQDLINATTNGGVDRSKPGTGVINLVKQNDKYQIIYSGHESDMQSSNIERPIRFATISVKRLEQSQA